MNSQQLGHSDLKVSRLSLGCVTFGREIGEQESMSMMDLALERGFRLFDTAEMYADGESERVIGRWLSARKSRSGVLIATKITPPVNAESLKDHCEASLRRLGTDVIDLYQYHSFHESVLSPDTARAMGDLISSGKVRYFGVSNFSDNELGRLEQLHAELGVPGPCSLQNNHNLAVRDFTPELLDLCRNTGVGTISYSPLGAGFLTGKYSGGIPEGTRFDIRPGHRQHYFNERGTRTLERLGILSESTGLSQVELALGWALHQADITTTLVGGRRPEHLIQAHQALESDPGKWMEELDDGF